MKILFSGIAIEKHCPFGLVFDISKDICECPDSCGKLENLQKTAANLQPTANYNNQTTTVEENIRIPKNAIPYKPVLFYKLKSIGESQLTPIQAHAYSFLEQTPDQKYSEQTSSQPSVSYHKSEFIPKLTPLAQTQIQASAYQKYLHSPQMLLQVLASTYKPVAQQSIPASTYTTVAETSSIQPPSEKITVQQIPTQQSYVAVVLREYNPQKTTQSQFSCINRKDGYYIKNNCTQTFFVCAKGFFLLLI